MNNPTEPEVKPCPGCGEQMHLANRQAMKPPMLTCLNDTVCHFSLIEILPREYADAYCWRELAQVREKYEGEVKYFKTLSEALGRTLESKTVELKDISQICNELGAELDSLRQENSHLLDLLATERDKFGQRETELMVQGKEFREALKSIRSHDSFETIMDCVNSVLAKYPENKNG